MRQKAREKPLRGALCPECGGRLYPGEKPFRVRDILLGTFPVHECERCGEYGFTPAGSRAIDKAAKARGLFGLEAEEGSHAPIAHARTGRAHA